MPDKRIIALCPNAERDEGFKNSHEAEKALRDAGFEVILSPVFRPGSVLEGKYPSLPEAAEKSSLMVALGGDGTMLQVARAAMKTATPIIGINLGHKGFMAELAAGDHEKLLIAAAGSYTPVRRMMIDVELTRGGRVIYSDSALNDAVVGGVATAVFLTAYGDGTKITEYSGDGLILATPTGSTAYSLSAGGPMVEPTAENIILTPICAHLTTARPLVLSSDRRVTVVTEHNAGKRIWLSVDGGQPITLLDGDELHIKKSENATIMAKVTGKSFYDIAFEKLGGLQ